jgi:hypothetical protein
MISSYNTRIKKNQHRDYTYKTVQIVYAATKQTTSTYYSYNTVQLTTFL